MTSIQNDTEAAMRQAPRKPQLGGHRSRLCPVKDCGPLYGSGLIFSLLFALALTVPFTLLFALVAASTRTGSSLVALDEDHISSGRAVRIDVAGWVSGAQSR